VQLRRAIGQLVIVDCIGPYFGVGQVVSSNDRDVFDAALARSLRPIMSGRPGRFDLSGACCPDEALARRRSNDAGRDAFLFHSVDLLEISIRGAEIFSTNRKLTQCSKW
jgi:hypothetical protein